MQTKEEILRDFEEREAAQRRAEENHHIRTRGYKKYRNPQTHLTPKKKKR